MQRVEISLAGIMDKMICNKADICGIDCEDKKPHNKELACNIECDWHGKCVLLEVPDKYLDDEVESRLSSETD